MRRRAYIGGISDLWRSLSLSEAAISPAWPARALHLPNARRDGEYRVLFPPRLGALNIVHGPGDRIHDVRGQRDIAQLDPKRLSLGHAVLDYRLERFCY